MPRVVRRLRRFRIGHGDSRGTDQISSPAARTQTPAAKRDCDRTAISPPPAKGPIRQQSEQSWAQTRLARSIASKPFIQMIFIMGGAAQTWLRTREATFSPDPSPFGRALLLHNDHVVRVSRQICHFSPPSRGKHQGAGVCEVFLLNLLQDRNSAP